MLAGVARSVLVRVDVGAWSVCLSRFAFISAKAVKNYILTSVFTKVIYQKCMHAEDEHIRQ